MLDASLCYRISPVADVPNFTLLPRPELVMFVLCVSATVAVITSLVYVCCHRVTVLLVKNVNKQQLTYFQNTVLIYRWNVKVGLHRPYLTYVVLKFPLKCMEI